MIAWRVGYRPAMFGLFDQSAGNADACWLIAFLALIVVAVVTLVQGHGRTWVTALTWAGVAFIPLGLMFLTG